MTVWGDDFHPSHDPADPRDIGFGTGLVYCRACGTLLRSDKGMALSARVRTPCVPVYVEVRDTVVPAGRPSGPLGFHSAYRPASRD